VTRVAPLRCTPMETDDGGREAFAQRVLAEVRSAGATEAWYDPDEFAIRYRQEPGEGDPPGVINLGNLFHEWHDAGPDELDERIRTFVDGMLHSPPTPKTWAEARPQLRPVLRPSTFGLRGPEPDWAPLRRPALPYLHELAVIDLPTVMSYVTSQMAADWGVRPAEVFAAARANLAAMAAAEPVAPGDIDTGNAILHFVDDGNGYLVSRLLLDGWLAQLEPTVGGRPVAFAPENNTLIVGADEPDLVARLYKLVEDQYREAPRSISPQAYTCTPDGRTVPYRVPADHPLAEVVNRAEVMLAATEYSAQGDWLGEDPEREYYVASLMVGTRPDGTLFTVASWGEDVDTLLPEAHYVAFSTADGADPFLVPWKVVAREANLWPAAGFDPPRYRVTTWPSPALLDRLRARAESP